MSKEPPNNFQLSRPQTVEKFFNKLSKGGCVRRRSEILQKTKLLKVLKTGVCNRAARLNNFSMPTPGSSVLFGNWNLRIIIKNLRIPKKNRQNAARNADRKSNYSWLINQWLSITFRVKISLISYRVRSPNLGQKFNWSPTTLERIESLVVRYSNRVNTILD